MRRRPVLTEQDTTTTLNEDTEVVWEYMDSQFERMEIMPLFREAANLAVIEF